MDEVKRDPPGRTSGSPYGWARFFFACAALIAIAYAAAHWAGWRDYTAVISGTSPTGAPLDGSMALRTLAYVGLYALFTLVAPIFLIAAALCTAFQWAWLRRRPAS
jgi:hypothetical protein